MRYQKRRILLLLDNCSAHVVVDDLQNVKLIFLPPNTTSKIQPLDQGIINSFKLNYRKLLLEHLIDHANKVQSLSEFAKSISVLNAIFWIDCAWNLVQRGTIQKCFKHCGIGLTVNDMEPAEENSEEWTNLSEIVNILPDFIAVDNLTIKNYISFDDSVDTSGTLNGNTIEELIESTVIEAAYKEEDEDPGSESDCDVEEIAVELSLPSKALIASHFADIRRFASKHNADDICSELLSLETKLNSRVIKSKMRQKKLFE
jgi:hypothetical protein